MTSEDWSNLAGEELPPEPAKASRPYRPRIVLIVSLLIVGALLVGGIIAGAFVGFRALRAQLYYDRGELQYSLGAYAEAVEDLSKAIEIEPNDPDTVYERGLALAKLGQPEKAIADFDRAEALDPDEPIIPYRRAGTWAALEKKEEAARDYEKARKSTAFFPPEDAERRPGTSAQSEAGRSPAEALRASGAGPSVLCSSS